MFFNIDLRIWYTVNTVQTEPGLFGVNEPFGDDSTRIGMIPRRETRDIIMNEWMGILQIGRNEA